MEAFADPGADEEFGFGDNALADDEDLRSSENSLSPNSDGLIFSTMDVFLLTLGGEACVAPRFGDEAEEETTEELDDDADADEFNGGIAALPATPGLL